jgi:mono/diheme cytochrome c family protein
MRRIAWISVASVALAVLVAAACGNSEGGGGGGGGSAAGASIYTTHCVSCHGATGHGDGPAGAALGASNLTDPAVQARVTDAQIAERIRKGGTKMPPNPALNDQQIADVTAHVRSLRH